MKCYQVSVLVEARIRFLRVGFGFNFGGLDPILLERHGSNIYEGRLHFFSGGLDPDPQPCYSLASSVGKFNRGLVPSDPGSKYKVLLEPECGIVLHTFGGSVLVL